MRVPELKIGDLKKKGRNLITPAFEHSTLNIPQTENRSVFHPNLFNSVNKSMRIPKGALRTGLNNSLFRQKKNWNYIGNSINSSLL